MAEDRRHRGQQPSHDQNDETVYPHESGFLPDEEEVRTRVIAYHSRPQMASGAVRLPAIQDPYAQPNGYPLPPGAPAPPSTGYSPPTVGNAYPPPPSSLPPCLPPYLPAVHAPAPDPRASYPPQDPMGQYFANYNSPHPYEFQFRSDRGAVGQYPEFARGGPVGAGVMQQSAPRQRTSIACRYCRRRKIRCSGYQNSPGGKCTNCIKMNQDCVFQPVSSSSSTAFVPVSALTNGIPPGTQLFGAYGQPLAGPSSGAYPATSPQYSQPQPSPTNSYDSFSEERQERPELRRRRPRPSDEEHGVRLPPPKTFRDDNPRRRSPSSSGSPGRLQLIPPTPVSLLQPQLQPLTVSYTGHDNRTPPPKGSPSVPPATHQNTSQNTSHNTSHNTSSVMSLENIMGTAPNPTTEYDQTMIKRLNQRSQRKD
ncbi:hypothetical protein F5Y00DRAFT_94014 [Daldinia vernicosa]|uniref:uncharacterized protein n=1 Tax=Daldinia vernicosa TaxID=114800 RepID=UPI0020084A4B|nr:uncharacterized protein F5Y00DRAFT_94014 [Daldinia vernicosa]KAI0848174.1 hypothetical protein F5Y00DRAFT_94014 [Daldinia vernicosa]